MRVLIVEDDVSLGVFLQKGLRLEGHDVDWVGDGEAALQYATDNRPDLIVLDLSLPKKDGTEVLPEKERMVLTLYYYEELTMKEIGQTLGVVESRVSQIHSSAVVRLRIALAALQGRSSCCKQKEAGTVAGSKRRSVEFS